MKGGSTYLLLLRLALFPPLILLFLWRILIDPTYIFIWIIGLIILIPILIWIIKKFPADKYPEDNMPPIFGYMFIIFGLIVGYFGVNAYMKYPENPPLLVLAGFLYLLIFGILMVYYKNKSKIAKLK